MGSAKMGIPWECLQSLQKEAAYRERSTKQEGARVSIRTEVGRQGPETGARRPELIMSQ